MRKKTLLLALIFTLLLITACTKKTNNQTDQNLSPPQTSPPSGFKAPTEPPSQKGPTGPPPTSKFPPIERSEEQADNDRCGIENCHGLDITCGPEVPDACTMDYQLGDFCRQFSVCEVIDGECQLVPNEIYDRCVECIKECEGLGGEPAFECEAECREELKY